MANNVFNFDAPKGSAVAFGTSLLGNIRKRTEDRENKLDRFGKKILGAKIIGKGINWVLEDNVNDFHKGNATVYGNLQGLINNSKNILTQNQAIVDSGVDYKKHFYDQAYDEISEEYQRGGKQTIGDARIRQLAERQGLLKQEEWKGLVSSANSVSNLSIEELKDQVAKDYGVAKTLTEKVITTGKRVLRGETKESIESQGKDITLDKLQGASFEGLKDFKIQMEAWVNSGNTQEQAVAAAIVTAVDVADKKIKDTKQSIGPVTEVLNNETGKMEKRGVIFHLITYEDDTQETIKEPYVVGEDLPTSLLTSAKMNALSDIFNTRGMAEFNESWSKLDQKQRTIGDAFDRIYTEVGRNEENLQVNIDEADIQNLRYKTLEGLMENTMLQNYDVRKPDQLEMLAGAIWNNYQSVNLLEELVADSTMSRDEFVTAILEGVAVLPSTGMPRD